MKIVLVAGARPNFIKIAPLMAAFGRKPSFQTLLVHTGQHYDRKMSEMFFQQLGIPQPDINLEVGSASHAVQTAKIMTRFEPVILQHRPDYVLVVGDVNSTIACGLVAAKLGIKLIHVEAGLRSFDRSMPEEINRILTDSISDLLFCSEESGVTNLKREGVPDEKIFFTGNVMIDTLLKHKQAADHSPILDALGIDGCPYALVTLHRPANVDRQDTLAGILGALRIVAGDMPVVFPVHPRTREMMENDSRFEIRDSRLGVRFIEPVGYIDFLKLMSSARIVFTDSGGIQEETTILNVPCLTLRDNTERPVTVEMGTNRLVGNDPGKILAAYHDIVNGNRPAAKTPPLWDGMAAERIAEVIRCY